MNKKERQAHTPCTSNTISITPFFFFFKSQGITMVTDNLDVLTIQVFTC